MRNPNEYRITREKFLNEQEQADLLNFCEQKAIIDFTKGRRTWIIRNFLINFALYTGLRVGEIANLQIGNIKLFKKHPYLTVINGKGGKDRDVAFDNELKRKMKFYLEQKDIWGHPTEPEHYLFGNYKGKKPVTMTLQNSFKQAIVQAGLRQTLSIHSARHTYATYLFHRTGNIALVKKQLGHSSIDMTTLYANIAPEYENELINKINNK